jgi:hypothetical protein
MKLKTTPDGKHAILKNGKPLYVMDNGTEREIDGAAAWELALGAHFQHSPVMAGLKIPADIVAATFGSHFDIQGGRLVALDKHGIKEYSSSRPGQVATFDEALGQLIDRYPNKAMILKEADAPAPGQSGRPGQQGRTGATMTRQRFDALPPASRAKFMNEGGRISDGTSAAASAPAPAQGGGTIGRAQFDAMGPRDRALHCSGGGKIVD